MCCVHTLTPLPVADQGSGHDIGPQSLIDAKQCPLLIHVYRCFRLLSTNALNIYVPSSECLLRALGFGFRFSRNSPLLQWIDNTASRHQEPRPAPPLSGVRGQSTNVFVYVYVCVLYMFYKMFFLYRCTILCFSNFLHQTSNVTPVSVRPLSPASSMWRDHD